MYQDLARTNPLKHEIWVELVFLVLVEMSHLKPSICSLASGQLG